MSEQRITTCLLTLVTIYNLEEEFSYSLLINRRQFKCQRKNVAVQKKSAYY